MEWNSQRKSLGKIVALSARNNVERKNGSNKNVCEKKMVRRGSSEMQWGEFWGRERERAIASQPVAEEKYDK